MNKVAMMQIDVLRSFEQRALESSTTGLVIWKNGKKLVSYGEEIKVPLYSLTKAIVSLAIGFLFDEGKIKSVDTPVNHWFEEWKEGPKSKVTLRMLLTHTSGIEDHFIDMEGGFNVDKFEAFKKVPDVIEAAMRLEVVKEPGTHGSYSNSSADILVALVNKLSGMRIDRYIENKLFAPLEITDWNWVSSTKQLFGIDDDTPSGADGLVMTAQDLLKIGVLILQNGLYNGKQLLSSCWISLMTSEVPEVCMTIPLGESALTNQKDLECPGKYLPALEGTRPIPLEPYSSAFLWLVPKSLAKEKKSEVFLGWGFLGQYLMIIPAKKIVAVRLYHEGLPDFAALEDNIRVSFADFEYWIRKL